MAYSQNNEEEVILSIAERAGLKGGRFLDIGAYDGKTFSNTLKLAEMGWSGVCVEPSPAAFTGLLKIHKNNPEVILVNSAISTDGGWLDFYDSNGDAVSSSVPSHVSKWRMGGVNFTRFLLKSISVEELFTKFGHAYDFINLDVEGLNWELFQALPWQQLTQMRAICVEHDGHSNDMINFAAPYNFIKESINAENLILAKL